MKVALVHDHLIQSGGAERVLEAFAALWPEAPIYTLLYHPHMEAQFGHRDVRTSFLQQMPMALSDARFYLPLMPSATEQHDLRDFDVVISSASAFSKGIITSPDAVHICYCHTPTRYLWSDTHSYVAELRAPRIVKKLLPHLLSKLRVWDRLSADRVDHFIANSHAVAGRIQRYYRRDSTVIYPPVDIDQFHVSDAPKTYYLIGGRLVSYKRYDLVIDAFNRLGLPLKIFGTGPVEKSLRRRAGKNVEFLGAVSNQERAHLFAGAIAFLHPHEEDFGITAVESMAAGRPVIAYRKGGAIESVIEGKTGAFFDEQSPEELADTILRFNPEAFDSRVIRTHAETFSVVEFHKQIREFVEKTWEAHRRKTRGLP